MRTVTSTAHGQQLGLTQLLFLVEDDMMPRATFEDDMILNIKVIPSALPEMTESSSFVATVMTLGNLRVTGKTSLMGDFITNNIHTERYLQAFFVHAVSNMFCPVKCMQRMCVCMYVGVCVRVHACVCVCVCGRPQIPAKTVEGN